MTPVVSLEGLLFYFELNWESAWMKAFSTGLWGLRQAEAREDQPCAVTGVVSLQA